MRKHHYFHVKVANLMAKRPSSVNCLWKARASHTSITGAPALTPSASFEPQVNRMCLLLNVLSMFTFKSVYFAIKTNVK